MKEKSLSKHVDKLLSRVPSQRPLPKEWFEEINSMSIIERERLAGTCDAILDSFKAHVKDLEHIKELAEARPKLKAIK